MASHQRVVTSLPLDHLWSDQGDVAATRAEYLDAETIRALLRQGPVRFVVANAGAPLRWIPPSHRFDFWKSDAALHLAQGHACDLAAYPDGWAYVASRWSGARDDAPILLLEVHH